MKRFLAAAMLALAVPFAWSLSAADAAPAKRDWTKTVTATPTGAYVLGNPNAKVKLVEYLSFTCSHCAQFTVEGFPVLKDRYVASGQVSVELRNAVRDRFDLTAALLSRCQGAAGVFQATELLMAKQAEWMEKAMAFDVAEQQKLRGMPLGDGLAVLAAGAGLDAMMRTRGLTPAGAKACLANKAEQDRLAAMAGEAWRERKLPGTPGFLINGSHVAEARSWATLEPALIAALQ